MNPGILENIPRVYTAISEWSACMLFIVVLMQRKLDVRFVLKSLGFLVFQSVYLVITNFLPLFFWLPSMIGALMIMFLFIGVMTSIKVTDAIYFCVQAFVIAEFMASFEWQIYCYLHTYSKSVYRIKHLIFLVILSLIWIFLLRMEKKYATKDKEIHVGKKELWSAVAIVAAVFAVSNISFISFNSPFTSTRTMDIFNIRTLVDFGGVTILYAHHIQINELRIKHELEAMQNILNTQYQQYQQSKESIDILNYKYHDLKHQLEFIRCETNSEKRNTILTKLQDDITQYEVQNKTGNAVLDTILTTKKMVCAKNDIVLTCVADGNLLNFLDVMDLCSIFGNALDNAIECELQNEVHEKRLIHISVSAQQAFLMIRIENYYEGQLIFQDNLPETTKTDKVYHGYGLKSIRATVKKYDGIVKISNRNGWFELTILIPMQ